jgi:hypothetical protein
VPYKYWKFQDVLGQHGQCFRTDFQSFKMVQDGFQGAAFQDGSLLSVYFQSAFNMYTKW